MTSPSMMLLKRRYHKSRSRKKDSNTRFKKGVAHRAAVSKVASKPPHITHKRLTNKNGFYFKGAVLSSPQCRGTKEHLKAKRDCKDNDLHCLLKAANDPKMSAPCTSSSVSKISDDCDDPHVLNNLHPKETRKKQKTTHRVPHHHSRRDLYEVDSQTSPEINQNFSEGASMEFSDGKPIQNQTFPGNCNDIDDRNHGTCSSLKDHSLETNTLSVDCNPLIKKRRGSISSYHKFAVDIADSLLSEKKKHFPSHSKLSITEDLTRIFNKIHDGNPSCGQLEPDKTKIAITQEDSKNGWKGSANVISDKFAEKASNGISNLQSNNINQTVSDQGKFDRQANDQHILENRTFKEKSVEAWVRAVQENVTNKGRKDLITDKGMSKHAAVKTQTESAFLTNIKRNYPPLHHKRADQQSYFKKTDNLSLFPNWNQTSVSQLFILPPEPNISKNDNRSSVIDQKNCYEGNQQPFDPKSCFVSFNRDERPNRFLEDKDLQMNNLTDSIHEKGRNKSIELDSPLHFNHEGINPNTSEKPWGPWLPWFWKPDESYQKGERKLESPDCVSPSPCFMFSPPKQLTKHGLPFISDKRSSEWNPFSKHRIQKCNPILDFGKDFNSRKGYKNDKNLNQPSFEFSPRKMF